MTKIINSKYKASRRLGVAVWGSNKDSFHKKNYRPGQHGLSSTAKVSDYGLHLRAKQRLKCHYGRVSENQFRNTFFTASKMKGNASENFISLLESRLDVVIYRMNIAPSIFSARQLVSHGHIKVNGKKVNIPSYRLNALDLIELREQTKNLTLILESINRKSRVVPGYLAFDVELMSGKFLRAPLISDVPFPFDPEVHLVVELYSR